MENEELKRKVEETAKKIGGCDIFSSLFTENYLKDPYCMLQLTIAISLDKPIYLLVEEGLMPNSKVLKICDGWEFFKRGDEQSLKEATTRLLDLAKQQGHWGEKKNGL